MEPPSHTSLPLEIQEIERDRPLRQGDVLTERLALDDPLKAMGVVVTADCHIAKRKHRGIVNVVPLLPTRYYLAITWLDDAVSRCRQRAEEQLHALARRAQETAQGRPSRLTLERMATWAEEAQPDEIADALSLSEGKQRVECTTLAGLIRDSARLLYGDYERARKLLRRFFEEAKIGREPVKLSEQLKDLMRGLPDDAFFIRGGAGLGEIHGYVCYLRFMHTLNERDISLTNKPLLDGSELTYRRVGRLRSPYVFALTQQLGHVFSTIGLSNDYESLRDDAAESCARWLREG